MKNNHITSFVNQLSWLADVEKIDILRQVFNINALCNEEYVDAGNVLTEYVLMVTENTHLDRGLLDYLKFWKQFLTGKYANSKVNNIYFSDNDAVKTCIQKEEGLQDDKEIDFTLS